MREIKFRAWDKDENKMLEWNYLTRWQGTYFNSDFWDVMQYTSLHDKNGKEIWESDIVKSDWIGDRVQRLTNAVVIFSQGRFTCQGGLLFDLYKYPELEVIGNIYENPELLKGKQ